MTDAAYSTACSQRNESHAIFVTRNFYNTHDVILLHAIYKLYRVWGRGGGGLRRGSLCSPNKLIMRSLQHYTVSEIIFTTRWGSLVTNARININVLSNLLPYGARWGSGDLQLHRVNCYMPPPLRHN